MPKELFIASSPHETKVAVLDDDQLVEVYYERDTDVGLVGGIYKGRVNRVLPGMQSAFVDIGLERDAFLYVSDFFEDAEEYDKVVTEAEARVNRLTDKANASTETPRPVETTASTEAAPAPEVAPSESASSVAPSVVIQEAPAEPVAPVETAAPPVEAQAPVAPTVPLAVPPQTSAPASSERPPFDRQRDQRDFRGHDHRGRRRRRGRGRGRFEDNKFQRQESRERPPAPSAPHHEEPSQSHSFEVLPGESLAKYSHHAPEAHAAEPAVEHVSEEPHEAGHLEAATFAEPPTEKHIEAAMPEAAVPETVIPSMVPAPAIEPAPPLAVPTPEPVAFQPESPVATAPSTEAEDKPRSLWNRVASSIFGETPRAADEAPKPEAVETRAEAAAEEPSVEEPIHEGEENDADLESEPESAGEYQAESGMESDQAGEAGEIAEDQSEHHEEPAYGEAPQPATPGEPTERSYTLREPTRAPHFAPRRRRGRRGRGGRRDFRPSGGEGQKPRQESRPGNHQPVQISELLKEGQEILVQIAKEPLGRKGARITSHIALPGRYLVYMPTVDHIGVSRKIGSEEERLRLRNLILEHKGAITGGFIVRTAAAGRPDDELIADIRFLSSLWSDIRRKAEKTKAPALLHADLNLVQRILRDTLSPDFKTIWLDSETEYARTVEFVNRCQPTLVGHVKFYTRPTPLFEEFGIEGEIEKALKPKVWLKSGGYIVINQTEALVAIDVNTGKYVGKTNRLEDTIVKTNIDAVNEIVRQIRMRDLGGIIVIDFIDMDERRNRNKVVQALEEALRKDRAPTKILAFNDFGLVAVTRKRVKQSLERTLCEPCNYCAGAGWIKSITTVCNEILAEARKMASQLEGDVVTLRVNPEVARALKSRENAGLNELESILHKDVIVKSDASVHQERFEIYGG